MTKTKLICPGCLRDNEEVLKEGCGSQRCPPSEEMSAYKVKKLKAEQRKLDKLIKQGPAILYAKQSKESLDEYAKWTRKMWLSKNLKERDLTIMTIGLGEEAGEVLGLLKKRVRDGNLDLNNLKKELGDVLYYWAMLCNYFKISPTDVIATNMFKIEDRHKRGTLRGSGDDR